ncbi:MAG: cobalamin-dependent protein [Patescibacteria group bacterium]
MRKRIILAARYYSIEPLGILYLAGLVRDAGWDCKVVLVNEFDFEPLYEAVRNWKPHMVGIQIWTGYHKPAFAACDTMRNMGVTVAIGGPHATYFHDECARHADFVVKGGGFGILRELLAGRLAAGVHFEKSGRTETFPIPDRDVVYDAYPELGKSPIKSIFASVGCPFFCTYCYAPAFNQMHGGFLLTVRPVDDIIKEARDILARWPLHMVYFQDDIFGYNEQWLKEFAVKWKSQVGVPFHCQIRLELTQHDKGARRLDLFKEAGCTGITLAIESGNAFLRDHVLFRHMPDELILDGCRKIMDRGMTLRTEQILAVPFSDTITDLTTLDLNGKINPTMAWTSILAPYQGTDMGTIAHNFGLYRGNNDDLAETFFDRSVLRHVRGGPKDIEALMGHHNPKSRALLKLRARPMGDLVGDVCGVESDATLGIIHYLTEVENRRYGEDTVRLQRLFNWLAKIPAPVALGRTLVNIPDAKWSWKSIGEATKAHMRAHMGKKVEQWSQELAVQMSVETLPGPIAVNPSYFAFFPEGGALAKKVIERGVFDPNRTFQESLDELGTMTRRHLFHFGLYMIERGRAPIASP